MTDFTLYHVEALTNLVIDRKNNARFLFFGIKNYTELTSAAIFKFVKFAAYQEIQQMYQQVKSQPLNVFRVISTPSNEPLLAKRFSGVNNMKTIIIVTNAADKHKYAVAPKAIYQWKLIRENDNKCLPNFTPVTVENILRSNLSVLIKHKDSEAAKKDYRDIRQWFYPEDQMEDSDIVKAYTMDSALSKCVNSLVNNGEDPLQLSYIRYPVSKLYYLIRDAYRNSVKTKLEVYKGGKISQMGLKYLQANIGGTIEMLGFMVTSTDIQAANTEVNNVILIVTVQVKNRAIQLDHGFTIVNEKVVFNCFNTFKISGVESVNGQHKIRLDYGEMANAQYNTKNVAQYKNLELERYLEQLRLISKINSQGQLLHRCCQYDDSIKFTRQQLDSCKQPGRRNKIILELGNIYFGNQDYDKSLEHYQLVIPSLESIQLEDRQFAEVYSEIAKIYRVKSRIDESINYYNQSLTKYLKIFGPENKQVAKVYKNIGKLSSLKGENYKALKNYLLCLKIQIKLYGYVHKETSHTYMQIGTVYYALEEFDKSQGYFEKVQQISTNLFGDNNPVTAQAILWLGKIFSKKDEYAKSIQYCHNALEMQLKVLGEEHDLVAQTIHEIAIIHAEHGEFEDSINCLMKLLSVAIKKYGPKHEKTAKICHRIGKVYVQANIKDQALQYYNRCFKIIYSLKKFDNSFIDLSLEIAKLLIDRNMLNEAKGFLNNAIDQIDAVTGLDPITSIQIDALLGEVYQRQAETKLAYAAYQKVLAKTINEYGRDSIQSANAYFKISQLAQSLRIYGVAKSSLEDAFTISKKLKGKDDPQVKKYEQELQELNTLQI